MAIEMGLSQLEIFGDSARVIKQIIGDFEVEKKTSSCHIKKRLKDCCKNFKCHPRACTRAAIPKRTRLAGSLQVRYAEARPERIPISRKVGSAYLGEILEEEETNLVSVYAIEEEDWQLHQNSACSTTRCTDDPTTGSYSKVVSKEEGQAILAEAHGRDLRCPSSGPKLHLQVKQLGYYWPTMLRGRDRIALYIQRWPPRHSKLGNGHHRSNQPKVVGKSPDISWLPRSIFLSGRKRQLIKKSKLPPWSISFGHKSCIEIRIRREDAHGIQPCRQWLGEAFNKTLCKILKKTSRGNKKDWHEKARRSTVGIQDYVPNANKSTPYSLVYTAWKLCAHRKFKFHRHAKLLFEKDSRKRKISDSRKELESLDEKRLEAQRKA
ncbi:hypothetical protein H6P81_012421 [Aristolochia fimbriata]|uniref:RNase H type-1 domain-containing protein n=1 Tax=Aristolochia fimbriata TaxID=158543 RepID=A0AAV7EC26_ARIFI|nr:hypothetical protein H6P81_012421 [Aristolochia fimbriata]